MELWLVGEYSSSSQKAIFSSSNKPVFWQRGFSCIFKYSKEDEDCEVVQVQPGSPLKAKFAQEDHKNFATFSSFSFLTQSEGGTSWKERRHEIIPLLPFYSISRYWISTCNLMNFNKINAVLQSWAVVYNTYNHELYSL